MYGGVCSEKNPEKIVSKEGLEVGYCGNPFGCD